MWNRTYVQTFNQRSVFDSKTILADSAWSKVVFGPDSFKGGELVAQELSLDEVVNIHYNGQISDLFIELLSDKDSKWAIVVGYVDYYKLLAYYLKELQHTFSLSDENLHLLAFTFMYNNFYYSGDQGFVDGFVSKKFQAIMTQVFTEYTAVGVLDMLDHSSFPTEVAYFLLEKGIIPDEAVHEKLVTIAKMVVARLWQVHLNDYSEWLILDTQYFLNMLKSPATADVSATEFTFTDMFNMIHSDEYLNSMFFTEFPFFSSMDTWDSDPNFKVTASRLVGTWERLADYLVQRGIDEEWAKLRHVQYAEIILNYESIKSTCAALKYILQLDGAPETLDTPVLDMLGYDTLSECFNTKYNKTLLLVAMKGMSPAFEGFIVDAFTIPEDKVIVIDPPAEGISQ